MRRLFLMAGLVLLAATSVLAQSATSTPAKAPASFDLTAIDKSVDPCVDFYHYACGSWLKNNPIPPDQSSWGRFNELHEHNQVILRGILDKQSADNASRNPVDQKIGDYYYSCMDEAAIESKGLAPLKPYMDSIDNMKSKADVPTVLAGLHKGGVNAFFNFGSDPDFKNSKVNIAAMYQGGLSLPDKDYYFKDDAKSVELRQKLEQHIAKTFELYGEPAGKAAADAKTVMKVETDLAKGSLNRTEQRDPEKLYHKMSVADLQKLSPDFAWNPYIKALQPPSFDSLNVGMPDYVKAMNSLLATNDFEAVKTYMRWQTLRSATPMLPKEFVRKTSSSTARPCAAPRSSRPVGSAASSTPTTISARPSVRLMSPKTFPPEAKASTLKMVHELEAALKTDISDLSWMTPETKKQALEKLSASTTRSAIPTSGAITARSTSCAAMPSATPSAPTSSSSTASSRKSASRSTAPSGA